MAYERAREFTRLSSVETFGSVFRGPLTYGANFPPPFHRPLANYANNALGVLGRSAFPPTGRHPPRWARRPAVFHHIQRAFRCKVRLLAGAHAR